MVQVHVRRRKRDGAMQVWDVGGHMGVLSGHATMKKSWRRGSVECMDAATISESLKWFEAHGSYYGPEAVVVVPETAVADALNGKIIQDVQAEYPCIVVPMSDRPNQDAGEYIRRVQEDVRRLQERAAAQA